MQRLLLAALLIAAAASAVGPISSPALAAPTTGGLVVEVITLLDQQYVEQALIDRVRLLNVALESMQAALSRAGIAAELQRIPPGTGASEAERIFRERFDAVVAAGQGSAQALAYAAIRAMTASLNDSHTGFMSPEEYRERQARQRQAAGFSGVGMVVFPKEQRFYVWEVIPNGPASRLGVRRFDRIVRINDTPTGGMTADQVVSMIRGPTGTAVTILFERADRPAPFPVTITRAPIVVPSLFAARMVERGIGYIYLYEFSSGSARDFRRALQQLMGQGLRVLIIDLRNNSGGFLHELRSIMNTLLPTGLPVYQSTTSQGTQVVKTDRKPLLPRTIPIVVLVNDGTASASELLTAAIAEHARGTVIGTKSSGAVEASVVFELSDGSALSVTIQRLATGKGRRLEGNGIVPDVQLDLTAADFTAGQDAQLLRAVQVARQRVARALLLPSAGR
ncbi:MAG TPA: S41 family peptidase [bacterium]|jgi:carboxyl-terminal processing protease|nr:S41 family peptidase [bacterium]